MRKNLAALVAFVMFVSTACGSAEVRAPSGSAGPGSSSAETSVGAVGIELVSAHVPRASAAPEAASTSAASVDAFGLDLYRRAAATGGNVVVSPASIVLALAMARAGARGDTAAEMDAVLRAGGREEQATGLNALDAALASRSRSFPGPDGTDLAVTLRIANAPFAQRGMSLEPAYLEALASRFGAGLRLVDYRADPDAARRLINGWVSEQTEERIPELLLPGIIDTMTRLTLVNAIYLKAPWAYPFDPEVTENGQFTRSDGSTVDVPMMAQTESLGYAETIGSGGWRVVELPYVGGSLALTVIVPDDLASFEASLTADVFSGVVDALRPRSVQLAFPRFGIETRANLADLLAAMGMPLAFDPLRADFSGITGDAALFISDVVHQANIDVDEKGTEAAAATAVVMRLSAAPSDGPVALRVDRPFLFALRDVPTGAILFLGRVTDPTAGA